MQVIISDLLTTYNVQGEGRVVLFLHGWGDDQRTFNVLASSTARNFKVVTLDLPGFGKTVAPSSAWSLDDYAKFVASFLEKLNLEPYAIIGHSNGGAISLRGLASGVLRSKRLILLASSGIRNEYQRGKKAVQLISKIAKLLIAPLPEKIRLRLRKQAYASLGSDMFVAEHLQETFKRIITDDVTQDAAKLSVPTLLIYGDNDQATPERYARKFHSLISGSKLEIITGSGHFVHHQEPDRIAVLVEEFLS